MPTERQLFLQHVAQTSDFPLSLEIDHAEGVYLFDRHGKKYVDLISGIGVSSVGHRHPKVITAIKEQVDKHLHVMVYGEFILSPQVQLAKALTSTLPDNLDTVYFVNSGSEAVEGALKLAKRFSGKSVIVSCQQAYHGSSHGALSVSGSEPFKQNFRPLLPGIRHIRFGIEEDLDQIDHQTAAMIVETVQGEAGVRIASKEYFQRLRRRCNETGTLLILDEIQCGFGRTGTFWAFEQHGIVPDILISAKGMGGGMPVGCFISSRKIMSVFKTNPVLGHITTFGGHPVSCAASLATLKVLTDESLIREVDQKQALFHRLLVHPAINEIRSSGLLMAVQFASFEILQNVIQRALELGVISDWFLFCDDSMRIAPPLTITQDEIREACHKIMKAIDDTC